jgi:hypothetical protein
MQTVIYTYGAEVRGVALVRLLDLRVLTDLLARQVTQEQQARLAQLD